MRNEAARKKGYQPKTKQTKKIKKMVADKQLQRKVSEEQANRLMRISRFGEACKSGRLDNEMIHKFLEERRLAIISSKLPHAAGGISKKATIGSKIARKDPVLDYFFEVHNKMLNFTIEKFE